MTKALLSCWRLRCLSVFVYSVLHHARAGRMLSFRHRSLFRWSSRSRDRARCPICGGPPLRTTNSTRWPSRRLSIISACERHGTAWIKPGPPRRKAGLNFGRVSTLRPAFRAISANTRVLIGTTQPITHLGSRPAMKWTCGDGFARHVMPHASMLSLHRRTSMRQPSH